MSPNARESFAVSELEIPVQQSQSEIVLYAVTAEQWHHLGGDNVQAAQEIKERAHVAEVRKRVESINVVGANRDGHGMCRW
ncbi:MAG: hypothetical protein Q9207_002428 [Kuettlingeria erythrocarpa]